MAERERFKNRIQAGKLLAKGLAIDGPQPRLEPSPRLEPGPGPIVLALPRGGVPVGFAVAMMLGLELDVLLVRKLGLPGQPEFAIGAVGSGGVRVLQPGQPDVPGLMGVTREQVEALAARELDEIARRTRLYRGGRPDPVLAQRTVIIVDDGIATGSTMAAAVRMARQRQAARVVVAVPVAPPDTLGELGPEVDALFCLKAPRRFRAVSQWYDTFEQTSDEEVQDLLALAWNRQAGRPLHKQPIEKDRT